MAAPSTVRGTGFRVLLENPAQPNVFGAPCGLNERAITFTKAMNEIKIPDCDLPDAPIQIARDVDSLDCSINGSGVLALESRATWEAFRVASTAWRCRVELYNSSNVRVGYYQGSFHLGSLGFGGNRGERVTIEVEMAQDGEVTWTTG
jgi:Phage tail tube protein